MRHVLLGCWDQISDGPSLHSLSMLATWRCVDTLNSFSILTDVYNINQRCLWIVRKMYSETALTSATWHRPHFFCEDSWCHIYRSPLGFSACSQHHQLVRLTSVCSEVTASTRNVWRSTSASIQGRDHFENLPHLKRLVGFHISHR